MAMKGLSLDGAIKLMAALDAFESDFICWDSLSNSAAYYGKNTKISKTFDEIKAYVSKRGAAGQKLIDNYHNQLKQIIDRYSSFDNTGNSTLGKVIPTQKKS